MTSRSYIISLFTITALLLITFAVLNYLQIPAGTLIDWVIGIVAFWWLIGVTTIPWNMYFAAREVLFEAKLSIDKGISINDTDLTYAKNVSKRFFLVAIILHLLTAIILYLLAYYNITVIGYFASIIALLLTFVRPTHRLYDHISHRLRLLSQQIKYPREDIALLLRRTSDIESKLEKLRGISDPQIENSWARKMEMLNYNTKEELHILSEAFNGLNAKNKQEHEALGKKTEEEVARFSEDVQFLNQVREIIRFFKKA